MHKFHVAIGVVFNGRPLETEANLVQLLLQSLLKNLDIGPLLLILAGLLPQTIFGHLETLFKVILIGQLARKLLDFYLEHISQLALLWIHE